MKKLIYSFLLGVFCGAFFLLSGCHSVKFLSEKLVFVRSDYYSGEANGISLIAENVWFIDDGVKNEGLKFVITNETLENATYFVSISSSELKKEFTINPITNKLTTFISIENFKEKEFNATVFVGSSSAEINLKSVLPENVLNVTKALERLNQNQSALISSYTDKNGNFLGAITLLVSYRNEKAYYFVSIKGEDGKTRAFLLDGITGDVLAVRKG